jgi:hypothetical protein
MIFRVLSGPEDTSLMRQTRLAEEKRYIVR